MTRYGYAVRAAALCTVIAFSSSAEAQIDLGDVVAGGDGSGNADAANLGLDPRNGLFVTAQNGATLRETDPEGDGFDPSPVDGTDFVDSVFIIGGDIQQDPAIPYAQPINLAGVSFEFPGPDALGTAWNHILRDTSGGGGPVVVGGASFDRGVGIHAAAGVTIDLVELRSTHGDEAVGCFSTVWGMDDCVSGDINVYAILSNDDEVLDSQSLPATAGVGGFLAMEIPAEAMYLTLATGSNGADACDHGTFANAEISASCPDAPAIESIAVTPSSLFLGPGGTQQLSVAAIDSLGLQSDVTASAAGTTYASSDPDLLNVGDDGLVTAGDTVGEATITVTNGELTAEVTAAITDFIDLGGIVAGGDGVTAPPEGNIGINADTGVFIQARLNADVPEADGFNPKLVDGLDGADNSDFIDSVFVMDAGIGQMITSTEVTFDFDAGDVAQGWEGILDGREPGGPDNIAFGDLGPFSRGVGCHASQGVTYDLDALRDAHGAARVQYFQALAGEMGTNAGSVNCYMILSGEEKVLDSRSALNMSGEAAFVEMEIPDDALFLTLAVGAAGNGIGSDHGGFGLAQISGSSVDSGELANLTATPSFMNLDIDETSQIALSGDVADGAFAGAQISVDPAAATYASGNEAIATVSDSGLVTGVSDGRTTVTVTLGADELAIPVTVGTVIDLGNIVRGGNGTDDFLVFDAIDPRSGVFVNGGIDGTIQETDVEGDGLNPSPVKESDFVDSVFFIGPTDNPDAETFAQEITQSGVSFDFPNADAIGTGWNYIQANANGGITDGPMLVGDQTFDRGLGVHSSMGITYDLDALREEHGAGAIATFSTFWGMDACDGDVNLYAILSDDGGVLSVQSSNALQNFGEAIEIPLPANAQYLTLATGSNGADGCDHGSFAEAVILPGDVIQPPDGDEFIRGDADASTAINITDGIFILNFLFLGGPNPPCEDAADADDSNAINITDGIYVLNFLFLGGPDPAAPYPDCGTDPDEDETVICTTAHANCE